MARPTRPKILVYCLVRDWTRFYYTSSDSKISGFTVYTLSDSLRIYFFPLWRADSKVANLPDACGWKPYAERKSCGFKNNRIPQGAHTLSVKFLNKIYFFCLSTYLSNVDLGELCLTVHRTASSCRYAKDLTFQNEK